MGENTSENYSQVRLCVADLLELVHYINVSH